MGAFQHHQPNKPLSMDSSLLDLECPGWSGRGAREEEGRPGLSEVETWVQGRAPLPIKLPASQASRSVSETLLSTL